MPSNSVGVITVVVDVIAKASYSFSPQDSLAACSRIPPGGTILRLPDKPQTGDRYEFVDLDGSCSPAKPITLVAGAGQTIEGGATFVFVSPFSWGFATFDEQLGAWALESPATGTPPLPPIFPAFVNPALGQAVWHQDYVLGSDVTGTGSALNPVQTLGEIYRRWQGGIPGTRPRLTLLLTTIFMHSPVQPGPNQLADPALRLADIDMAPGSTLVVQPATPTVKRSGTLNAIIHAFARTSTGRLTVTDAGIVDWSSDVDSLFLDTTQGASSWVNGTAAVNTQGILSSVRPVNNPLTPNATINSGLGPTVTVLNTDAYQIITPLSVYFGTGSYTRRFPSGLVGLGLGSPNVVFSRLRGLASTPAESIDVNSDFDTAAGFGASVCFSECRIDPYIQSTSPGGAKFFNCSLMLGVGLGNISGFAGASLAYAGYARSFVGLFGGGVIDQDFASMQQIRSQGSSGSAPNVIGNVAAYAGGNFALEIVFGGHVYVFGFIDGGAVFYGTCTTMIARCNLGTSLVSFPAPASPHYVFNLDAYRFGAFTTGFFQDPATGVWSAAIALTFANLDAAQPLGFGGRSSQPQMLAAVANSFL
jgi:hypothetical protein